MPSAVSSRAEGLGASPCADAETRSKALPRPLPHAGQVSWSLQTFLLVRTSHETCGAPVQDEHAGPFVRKRFPRPRRQPQSIKPHGGPSELGPAPGDRPHCLSLFTEPVSPPQSSSSVPRAFLHLLPHFTSFCFSTPLLCLFLGSLQRKYNSRLQGLFCRGTALTGLVLGA